MKNYPAVILFYSDKYRYVSLELPHRVSLFTSLMTSNILLRYITWLPNFGGTILSILLALTKEYTLLYIPYEFQGVWMTQFFRQLVFNIYF